MKLHSRTALAVGIGLAFGIAGAASADQLFFDLTDEFSGAATPDGTYTALLEDGVCGAGCVQITMTAGGGASDEKVDDWLFNLDPNLFNLDPALTVIGGYTVAYVSGSAANAVTISKNAYKADGDGNFDVMFDFPPPPSLNPNFSPNATSIYQITISGLTVDSFDFQSVGGDKGSFGSAAHIQGIASRPCNDGVGNCTSGWIGDNEGNGGGPPEQIPEPASIFLTGLGLVGLGLMRRRTRPN